MRRQQHNYRHRQQGVALIATLIFLVVLTLIGITGMHTSSMEERMAGNFKETHRSFQAAEEALRLAETYTSENVPGSNYQSNSGSMTDQYDSGDAYNAHEVIPQYQYQISAPAIREYLSDPSGIAGDSYTARSIKGGGEKLFIRRYLIDATGQAGASSETKLRSSYNIAEF